MATTVQAQAATELPATDLASAIEAEQNNTLDILMGGKPGVEAEAPEPVIIPEATPAVESEVIAEPETPVTEPAAADPVAEPVDEVTLDPDTGAKVPKRIRLDGTDKDKRTANLVNQMVRDFGISYLEAVSRVTGQITPAKAEPEVPAQVEPEPLPTSPAVQALEATVLELETQLDAEGANEGLFTPEIARLNKELSRANAKLEGERVRSEMQAQQQAERQQQTHQTQSQLLAGWQKERAAVNRDYPDAAQDGTTQDAQGMIIPPSRLFVNAKALTDQAKDPSHPMHADLSKPNAPRIFIEATAKKMGLDPATSTSPTVTPARPTPPAPASGFRSTTPKAPALTGEQAKAALVAETLGILGGAPAQPRRSSVIIG